MQKSQLIIDKSEELKKQVIADLKMLESTWEYNTPAGWSIRQALQYMRNLDFNAPSIREF